MAETVVLTVNGQRHVLTTEPDRPLLEVLREDLGLTGTKYGCGEGECGACTVLVNGRPIFSCITPVSNAHGESLQTIEGLASNGQLHPVQEAFLTENAFQCGYCTSGMILATIGLLRENPHLTDAQIQTGLGGHLCRCCGYPRILEAVRRAAGLKDQPAQP